MGIDITKLHEQIEYLKSQVVMAETNEKNVEKDLYELRERLTKIAI